MLIEQLRNILILVALLIVGLIINIIFFPNNPVCPDDFTNSEEEIADFEKWVDNFYNKNPNASMEEIMTARENFLIENNCKKKDKITTYLNEKQKLAEIDKNNYEDCLEKYLLQMKYLDNETLSEEFTFDKYQTKYFEPAALENLDLNYSKTARYFRTTLKEQLKDGINFDGKYTMAGTGFTGRGGYGWIVDRTNGKAYEIPYTGLDIQYRKDSNLIILSSKSHIKNLTYCEIDKEYNCQPLMEGNLAIMVYEVVPHYFLWENNQLKHLGPKEFNPLTNLFWENYFRDKC